MPIGMHWMLKRVLFSGKCLPVIIVQVGGTTTGPARCSTMDMPILGLPAKGTARSYRVSYYR
jgi:hypothetical protein